MWPLFRFLGRNLSNFSVVFWKIEKHQKDILKLSDLYNDKNNWQYYFERRHLLSLDFLVQAGQNKSDNYTPDVKALRLKIEV